MGLWDAFKQAIFVFLQQIESVVGDWGLAIIVLTVLVRLALMPLTIKQTKSMLEMQKVQPKIKELQAKYKDDKEKLQEETLKFYQENKVNPFGGCLPALLQMPLLIALYQVLGGTPGHPGILMKYFVENDTVGRFYFLIPDIAKTPSQVFAAQGALAAIPYVLLVLLFGLSVWLPQALMPGEKQQKMIGAYMGVVMLFFGWSAPAGVLLYWDVSSLWGVAQQQVIMGLAKRDEAEEIVVEPTGPIEPSKKTKSSKAKKKS
jgi:YidC/Oxa1 family membrane protein insertase